MSVRNYQSLAISLLKSNPEWLKKSDRELEQIAKEIQSDLEVTHRVVNVRRLTLALIRRRDELNKVEVGVPGPDKLKSRLEAKDLIAELCEGLNPGSRKKRPPYSKGDRVPILWHDGVYPPPMGEGVLRSEPKFVDKDRLYGWYAVVGVKEDFSDSGAGREYLGKRIVCIFDWSGGSIRGATNKPAWTPASVNLRSWRINYA